jgi:hypothetical protein
MSAIQRHAVSQRKNEVRSSMVFFVFLLCLVQNYYVCYLQLAMKPAHSVPATKTIPTFGSSSTASPTPSPAVAARYVTADKAGTQLQLALKPPCRGDFTVHVTRRGLVLAVWHPRGSIRQANTVEFGLIRGSSTLI